MTFGARAFVLIACACVTRPVAYAQPQSRSQQQPPSTPTPPLLPDQPPRFEDLVVVTASKSEQKLINAPATMTVLDGRRITNSGAQSFADIFRAVPGVNVTQLSVRDINVTSRQATGVGSNAQLALLDGRRLNLDFYGLVAWDLLPVDFDEIKQIEIIRGPASAVWGTNALAGVINILTKSPREMQGSSFTLGFGGFDRRVKEADAGTGWLYYVNGSHAQSVNDRWSFKISGGARSQDPFPRPTGEAIANAPAIRFANTGTTQPKFDARVDYDFPDGRQKVIFAGGLAGTTGILHSALGPFDIQSGSVLGHVRATYARNAMKINAFVNLLDGNASNLLTRDVTGRPLEFVFKNQTYDVEFSNVEVVGKRHVVSYGGNIRQNAFDLSLAALGNSRTEVGGFIQDEIFLSDRLRWVVGGRVDNFDVIGHPVFSPRTTFMVQPVPRHTIRASVNRAYRAPSFFENFFDLQIGSSLDLGLIAPGLSGRAFPFSIHAIGNQNLDQESLTAYELSYTGIVRNRAMVTVAAYVNRKADAMFLTQTRSYRAADPPAGWPLPPSVLDALVAAGHGLPSEYSYRNLGRVIDKGLELGLDVKLTNNTGAFVNHSFQTRPDPNFDINEVNLPPRHRFNAGLDFSQGRYFGGASVGYTGRAFWQDVPDPRLRGFTEPYMLVNTAFGIRGPRNGMTTSLKVTNLFNREIQQHVFGDVLKRQLLGELRLRF